MRIVWKDTGHHLQFKDVRYRKYTITRYNGGWITDYPGDANIYASVDCACNAIDQLIGNSKTRRPAEYRVKKGIVIIGSK